MAVEVKFGDSVATSVVVVSDTQITCTSPAGTGDVAVKVTTAGGVVTKADAFKYIPAPTVTTVAPATGPAAGATSITITGTGFKEGQA